MKSSFQKIWALILLDFKVEYRNRFDILGLMFFVVIISYVLSRSLQSADVYIYNQIFWVILLICSVSFSLKSFSKTKEEEVAYLYQLVSPYHIIFSKLLLNAILIFIGGMFLLMPGLLFFSGEESFGSFPVIQFIGLLSVVSFSLSSTFSLPSALVLATSNRSTLLGLLAFPVSIPTILLSINMGSELITQQHWNMNAMIMLLSIVLIMSTVSLFLFRYYWQR